MAENFELEILFRVKAEMEKLKKFRQETQDFSKDVRSANNNMAGSFVGVQKVLEICYLRLLCCGELYFKLE